MECEGVNQTTEVFDGKGSESAEDFQKFIYELFDKNGILNDLRAYLRGHIVNVLKSARTGDPPLCQKHFTQRLELPSQALNILIAEYLLRLEFTYTLSVFVSEIPLTNMIFDFAKTLLKGNTDAANLRFEDHDVWSVLNYLGVKCDSEHALNIVEMYKTQDHTPLLYCILKCMPMYRESEQVEDVNTSQESLSSSMNSWDAGKNAKRVHRNTSYHDKCRHYTFCKSCQNRFMRLKEKYRKKKKDFVQTIRKTNDSPISPKSPTENLMKNINVMERSLIDEMFQQLKSVYEAEVDMVKQEEESRVKRTIASHALQLQKRQEELEQQLSARRAALEAGAQHKRRALWGAARAVRAQHAHVVRAAGLLREQQDALHKKENNLKAQLRDAEESLKKRGEEMRIQISNELAILEGHLESMKIERDSLNKERSDLENLKSICDNKSKLIEARSGKENEDLKQNYNVLKDEIEALKTYIESTKMEPKCVTEIGTVTELIEIPNTSVMNNKHCVARHSKSDVDDRGARTPNRVVNDLKKQKNVNFSQPNLDEVYRELSREQSSSSIISEAEAAMEHDRQENDTIKLLVQENERLKEFAKQQHEHISALWSERARAQAQTAPGLFRPHTAPSMLPATNYFTVHGVNPSASTSTFGWRAGAGAGASVGGGGGGGAGEELRLFPGAAPRVLLPGDTLPFVGLLRDRRADSRRHLINQWRSLKRRSSPLSGVSKVKAPPPTHSERGHRDLAESIQQNLNEFPNLRIQDTQLSRDNNDVDGVREEPQNHLREPIPETLPIAKSKSREKSPKTVLKEAKEKLRNKSSIKEKPLSDKRDKSPNAMLREAKLRLRKLEIEAEAVEKSYLDFRRRQSELREGKKSVSFLKDTFNTDNVEKNLDIKRSRSFQKPNENRCKPGIPSTESNDAMKKDFDKYLLDYNTKFDIGGHFKNNTAVEKSKPIPMAYSEVYNENKRNTAKSVDYLATPLMEFRKLYHADKSSRSQARSQVEDYFGVRDSPKCEKETDFQKEHIISPVANKTSLPEVYTSRNIVSDNADNTAAMNITNMKVVENDGILSKSPRRKLDETEPEIINDVQIKDIDIVSDQTIGGCDVFLELPDLDIEETVSVKEDVSEFKRLETLRKIRNNKAAELEILKENINKIYNLQSPPTTDLTPVKEKPEQIVSPILLLEKICDKEKHIASENKNLLRVEVEDFCKVSTLKMSESQEDDLLIVVQSSVNTNDVPEDAQEIPPMTIVVSPKAKSTGSKEWDLENVDSPKPRSETPEQAAHLTRNDALNAIFNSDDKDMSSVDMQLELSKDNFKDLGDEIKDPYDDYPDDFSADVDNYNSRSEYGNNSPISLPKTSEDENFWDN